MVTMLRRTISSLGAFAAFLMAVGAAPAALPAPPPREPGARGSAPPLARPRGGSSYTSVPLGHPLEDRSEPAIRVRTDVR